MAHFKYTVLLMPNGNDKITGVPAQEIKCAPPLLFSDPYRPQHAWFPSTGACALSCL